MTRRAENRAAKEASILTAALKIFAQAGYSGASMEAIATAAGITKPTLYQYFDSKDRLFTAMLLQTRATMLTAFADPGQGNLVAQLHDFAWSYATTVLRPDMLALARLIIGEVQRFPDVGRAYQASGPDQLLAGMMHYLTAQRDAGYLTFDDAELAAQDLWGLILSAPRTQALYLPDAPPTHADLVRYIRNGLRVFLRAYSTNPTADVAALADLPPPQVTP